MLNKDKVIRRNVDIAIGVFALLIGIFILFLFRTIKERNRKNEELKEKNNEISMIAENLSLANHEVSEQKYVIDKKNKSIIDSLNYAKRIQTTILPSKTYIRQFLQDFFVFFRPRDIVSGDFYWFHQNISEGGSKIVIVIADCTGHGVPGAFMSLIGATLLNKIIKDNGEFNPAEILRKLDLAIQHDLRQKDTGNMDGMDAVICVIDVKEKNMLFSGAKNPIFYVQDDKPFFIKGSKEAVGGEQDEHHYTLHEIDLTKKTMFYLYSDGFQDQFSGKTGKKYMSKNFRDLLFRIHHLPLDKQLEALKSALFDWQEEEAQVDDILVFGAKIQL